jgi:hypothetical protein
MDFVAEARIARIERKGEERQRGLAAHEPGRPRVAYRRLPCSDSGGVPPAFSGRSRPSRPRS